MENKEEKNRSGYRCRPGNFGRAIATKRLAGDGIFVLINYCSSGKEAEEVLKEIQLGGGGRRLCTGGRIRFCPDRRDDKGNNPEYGHIDILVNNAGITRDGLIMRMTEEDFDRVLEINLKGCFHTIRHLSRWFLKQKYGRIINIASVVGIAGNAGQANYSASKAGIIGLTKSAARELVGRGITVNAVAPGFLRQR